MKKQPKKSEMLAMADPRRAGRKGSFYQQLDQIKDQTPGSTSGDIKVANDGQAEGGIS